jgi:hypothetical protein
LVVKPPAQFGNVFAKSVEMQIAVATASRSATRTLWSVPISTSLSPPPVPVPVVPLTGKVAPWSLDAHYATPVKLSPLPSTLPTAVGMPCGATT